MSVFSPKGRGLYVSPFLSFFSFSSSPPFLLLLAFLLGLFLFILFSSFFFLLLLLFSSILSDSFLYLIPLLKLSPSHLFQNYLQWPRQTFFMTTAKVFVRHNCASFFISVASFTYTQIFGVHFGHFNTALNLVQIQQRMSISNSFFQLVNNLYSGVLALATNSDLHLVVSSSRVTSFFKFLAIWVFFFLSSFLLYFSWWWV